MRVKIRGGTAAHSDPSLCVTCRFATIARGTSFRHEIVECEKLSYDQRRITFPVTFCTGYADSRQASLREMEEIAWVLRSDLQKNQVGFVKASTLKLKDRFVLADDWD